MKLPNGFGSVYKLSGNRRNPWIARKTTGWEIDEVTGNTKQRYITIGYYPTKQAALAALVNYNENPYDIKTDSITFAEVYERWSSIHFPSIVPSARRTWVSAFNHSKPLHKMRMRDIRANHLEGCIQNANVGNSTKQRMKSLYNLMYRYCLKCDIVDKDYAALCDRLKSESPKIIRIPYSNDEIQLLWDHVDFPFVDMVLIGIYSGWRPQELAILQISDIDLINWTCYGGLKTDAGRNRCVPIHPRIRDLVANNYKLAQSLGSKYLFNDPNGQQGTHLTYDKYRGRFDKINKKLGLSHRPHDTRHTFITLAKESGMNDYILKLIVGHAIEDITERVYTHRTMEQLQQEIQKIK
ncbi:MAG: tyrosine-type recombinase/integrase [Lachnospiraceae bacterium]|nr:tyrosine-type recombinase/integrase [Lachnospiraceae bacterium]